MLASSAIVCFKYHRNLLKTLMPKIVNHEERRQAFAQAAKKVIAEKGIESVRLTDIAKTAGVTTGSLGHYFEDKVTLIDAALKLLVADWDLRHQDQNGSFFEAMCTILPVDEESRLDAKVWITFTARAIANPDLAVTINEYYDSYQRRIAEYLHHHEGRNKAEAKTLAATVQTVVDGLMARAVTDPEGWPPAKQRALVKSALLSLVGPGALEKRNGKVIPAALKSDRSKKVR